MSEELTDEPILVRSPGGWMAPRGRRPAWDWVPESGAAPRPDRMPVWLRVAYRVPFLNRFAHEWMWWRGGWDVVPRGGSITPDMIVSDPPPGSITGLRPRTDR
jgi:hypothetical protein